MATLTRGQKAAQTRLRNASAKADSHTNQQVAAAGMSDNLKIAIDAEWGATERSNAAEEALLREYHYHALRCEELRNFLMGVGIVLPGWEN